MRSQPLERFLKYELDGPDAPSELADKAISLDQQIGQHEYNFRRAVRGRESIYAEVQDGNELACLLLHAVGFGMSKVFPIDVIAVSEELKKDSTSEAIAQLLSNAHATEYFSKAVRADYDNVHLVKQIPGGRPHGLCSDQLKFPRMSHCFAPSATKFYPFFCTLFVYQERLTSSFEVLIDPSLADLRHQLLAALSDAGLQTLVHKLVDSAKARVASSNPTFAQGKQLAVPTDESSVRNDHYLVLTPVPSVQMIYALDQAMELHWGSEWRGYQYMRLGGSKPHNMGSTVTNLSTKVSGEGNVNIRPMRAYVPPLRARLYATEDQLRERSFAYSTVLEIRSLQALGHFREPYGNPKEFKRWVALLPAALMPVLEPIAALRECKSVNLADTTFKFQIEKQFVCKTLPEQLLGRRASGQSYAAFGQHVASMIEARFMIYKDFAAGLGVRRKIAIARAAASLSRSLF